MNELDWEYIRSHTFGRHIQWRELFDARQLSEIDFDTLYAKEFAHGTDGHNARLIIARLTQVVDTITRHVEFLGE